ncbi:uncharacterized protein JCM10292_000759 [Rhodotorula paludigena]|uniref:uncharacterized protein n=1 Tax=Rhodotorula paludigena TaxID=86838 RepID=UPI003172EAF2
MFEARLEQAEVLKKVLDAVKELVTDANFDCSDEGIKLQAMDNSHVALVSLNLARSGFSQYRCDRDMSLGMSLASLSKIVKAAGNNDTITLRADESQDVLGLLFEAKKVDRVGEYEMKLMDIDQEHLGIPDTVYDAEVDLPSAEFARIIRDLKELGESVKIEVSKEGVRFSAEGDIGNASVTLKPSDRAGRANDDGSDSEEESEEEEDEEEEEEDEEEDEEPKEEDEDAELKDAEEEEDKKPEIDADADEEDGERVKKGSESPQKKRTKAVVLDSENEDENNDDDEDGEPSAKKVKSEKGAAKAVVKKEKKAPADKGKGKKKAAAAKKDKKKAKKDAKGKGKAKAKKGGDEGDNMAVHISLQQAVSLTFSIKYLANFAKSTPLSDRVQLHLSQEVPLLVAYPFEQGRIFYYLAPKIADE